MFENNNWDIDEEYLKDFIISENIKGFEDKKGEISELSLKQNIEKENKSSKNILQFKFNCSKLKTSKNKINSQFTDITTKKKTILNILKTVDNDNLNFNETNSSKLYTSFFKKQTVATFNLTNQYKQYTNSNAFYENETSIVQHNCDPKTLNSTIKSVLTFTQVMPNNENNLKRKKNVAFLESVNNKTKKVCITTRIELPDVSKQVIDIKQKDQLPLFFEKNILNRNNVNNSRKQILDLLKCQDQKNIKIPRIKQTVIRKFPGPAGLLPDDLNEIEIIDLNSINTVINNKISKYNDICSQNTKTLFSTGAWQFMIDDLPDNFELFDIANIKESAMEFSKMFKKVPYLAGIVQYINYNPNDPHIILKDLSGKIDACIHHNICKVYPNLFGTNTVILAKDVGVIMTSKNYICLIISIKNLVSIYSDNGRLVKTNLLEQLSVNNSNFNLYQSQNGKIDKIESFKENKQY